MCKSALTGHPSFGSEHVRALKPYLAGRQISAVAREFELDEAQIIKLASNENPLGMPIIARRAIEALAESGSAEYPDPDAYELKMSLKESFQVPHSWLTVGNGSSELLDIIVKAFVQNGQSVVVSQYAFSAYLLSILGVNARPIIVPALDFGHNLDAMLDAIEPDTKLIFIANPNNPTGTFHAPDQIRRFIERTPEDIVVVLDEAYAEYLADGQQSDIADLIGRYRNLIVVRTFSKIYALAGLRIGFAIAQEHLSELINKVRLPFNTSAYAQAAATAALADRDFVVQSRVENRMGLEQLYRGFDQMGLPYLRSFGNFVLVNVGDASEVFAKLLKYGVIVRPVANYELPNWLRVSVGLKDQNRRFLKILASIVMQDSIVKHEFKGASSCRN